MLDRKDLIQLAKTVARANPSAPVAYSYNGENYSYGEINETLRKELNEYAGSPQLFRQNKELIYSIIEETITDVLPKKVEENYGMFAEIKTFKQGEKIRFVRKSNSAKIRAKQFVTRVGLAGVYEVFKLGGVESFEIQTSAIGAACEISIEEFLDGRADFAEMIAIVMEGMDELIYREIGEALKSSLNQLPANNYHATAGFDEEAFDQLLNIADQYGKATIYCTFEFAVKMVPLEAWRYTEEMKAQIWNNGRLVDYKGHTVIIFPQGFTDETNSKKVVDPGYCWIIPAGGNDKPVKVAIEGSALSRDLEQADWSRKFEIYQKVGVVCMMTNNICCYVDTALLGKMTTWKLNYFDQLDYTGVKHHP